MQVRERTKEEIEAKYSQMGDYVKMDYLSSCLENPIDFDTKKFVLVKLSGLYETRKMFLDAGEMMRSAAEINTTVQNKINDFVKATELFIKSGNYNHAEACMKKALSFANDKQKKEVNESVKEFYKTQARAYMNDNKKQHAAGVYEKFLTLKLDEKGREEISDKLLELYNALGKIKEHRDLKEKIKKQCATHT